MTDVETLLGELGDLLVLDDERLVADVLAAVESEPAHKARGVAFLKVAAIVAVLIAGVVVAVPSTRDAVADWFGIDRLRIDRRDDLDLEVTPVPTSTVGAAPAVAPTTTSPIGEIVENVDGERVLITTFDGDLTDELITKTLSGTAVVIEVDIDGDPALWIEAPHEVMIERDGHPVVERIAAHTLLWQAGDRLWRIEGFARLEDAVEFARSQ